MSASSSSDDGATIGFLDESMWFEHFGLISYPRSGNSMLRKLLEEVTGLFSGSDTPPGRALGVALRDFGLAGEGRISHDVWVVKTHWPERRGQARIRMERGLLLWRQPMPTLLSFWHMTLTGTHSLTASDFDFARFADVWRQFVRDELDVWTAFYRWWLQQRAAGHIDLLVVSYERLLADKHGELARIVDFLYRPAESPCLSSQTRQRVEHAWAGAAREQQLAAARSRIAAAAGEVYRPRSGGRRAAPAQHYFDAELQALVAERCGGVQAELQALAAAAPAYSSTLVVQEWHDTGLHLNDTAVPVLRPQTADDPYARGQPWKWRLRKMAHLRRDWTPALAAVYDQAACSAADALLYNDEQLLPLLQRGLADDGFACALGVVRPVEQLAALVDGVFAQLSPHCPPCWVMNVHQLLPPGSNWLWRLAVHPQLLAVAAHVLGTAVDQLVLSTSQLVLRHADNPYSAWQWQRDPGHVCTLWLLLDDLLADDGTPALRFCRAWHTVADAALPRRAVRSPALLARLAVPERPFLRPVDPHASTSSSLTVAPRWREDDGSADDAPPTVADAVRRNSFVTSPPARRPVAEIDLERGPSAPDIVAVAAPAGAVLAHHGHAPLELRARSSNSDAGPQRAIVLRYVCRSARICQQTSNVFFPHCFSNAAFRRALYAVDPLAEPTPYLLVGPPRDDQLDLASLAFVH